MKQCNSLLNLIIILVLSGGFFSCVDDEPAVDSFEEGVFVVNEGNFGDGDGSISHFNEATGQTKFNIFSQKNNNQPLGDVVQSMAIKGEKAYIVVNNSNKVEVVNHTTMERITTIEDLSLPRYITFAGDLAYLTEWVSFTDPGRVAVINTTNNTVIKTIPVGYGPEGLLIKDNKLFVSNSFENTVSVIELSTETVGETITLGSSPGGILEDKNGKIWVINGGGYNSDWSPKNDGALVRINPATNSIEHTIEFGANVSNKIAMNPSKDIIYYTKGKEIFALDINETTAPEVPFITNSSIVGIYGIGVNPEDGVIYVADNNGNQSNGIIYRYQPDGTLIDNFDSGRGPNGFVFIP